MPILSAHRIGGARKGITLFERHPPLEWVLFLFSQPSF